MFLSLYTLFHILVRIFIFAKVFYLLCMTSYYPESYPVTILTWWIYFLIFDIWLEVVLPTSKNYTIYKEKKDSDNNDPLD